MNHSGLGQVDYNFTETQARDYFCAAAWAYRARETFGFLEAHHIAKYEDARATLQEMGWSEDGMDALEAQYVGMQASKWKVSVS
jgi:hypothetical protein